MFENANAVDLVVFGAILAFCGGVIVWGVLDIWSSRNRDRLAARPRII